MTYELFIMIGAVFSGFFGMIGAVIIAWFNRPKTEADATATLVGTITELVGNVAAMTKMLQEQKDITEKRDSRIDDLERTARERDARIDGLIAENDKLKLDVARLVKSVLEKDQQIKRLGEEIERWRVGRDADRKRITTLETERAQLVATVDDLQKKLENPPEIISDNGKKEAKSGDNQPKSTEIEKTETE